MWSLKIPLGTLDRWWQIIQSSIQCPNFNFLQLFITTWWAREFRLWVLFGKAPNRAIVRIYGKPHRFFFWGGGGSTLDFSAITRTWETTLVYTFLCSGVQAVNNKHSLYYFESKFLPAGKQNLRFLISTLCFSY